MQRADRTQDLGVTHDLRHAERGDGEEPGERDGPEEAANARGATLLHGEQGEQHHQRDGHHVVPEVRRDHLQAFHRREHRDGRRDDAVAIEQRGAEDAHSQQALAQRGPVFHRGGSERQHGNQPAFAVVVGAQHERDVLERDDDRQRPEQDREDAVDVGVREGNVAGTKDFFDGVQHAGADVAVDHANGADDQAGGEGFGG
jgi:hypothetical protein